MTRAVHYWQSAALALFCAGCSGASSDPVDAGPEAEAACPSENGATACSRYLDAWCGRFVRCCNAPGSCVLACHHLTKESTDYNACDVPACKAYAARTGFDCSEARYTSRQVCKATTDECVADLPLVACSDLIGGTSSAPPSCVAWGKQF